MRVKKAHRLSTQHYSITLHLDDLEKIYSIINESSDKVSVSDDKHEFDSIEELIEKRRKSKLKAIEIRGYQPHVSFSVSKFPRMVNIYTDGSDESLKPYMKIRLLLEERKRKGLYQITRSWVLYVLFVMPILVINAPPVNQFNHLHGYIYWSSYFLGMALVLIRGLNNDGYFSSIRMTRENEQDSFWSRNKDSLWVAAITAIITALLSIIAAYLLFKQGIK